MATARVLTFNLDVQEPAPATGEATHEQFIQAIRDAVVSRVQDPELRERIRGAKLVYGAGRGDYRGICYHGAWTNGSQHDFLEIAATGEESHIQLAGTTLHELGHTLAGVGEGHGKAWKQACKVLGLTVIAAGGQEYSPEHFEADLWKAIEALPHPVDGQPTFKGSLGGPAIARKPRPCSAGIGTRGGRSRGAGSGSRLRLWICDCPEGTPGRKVRVASDEWDATCNRCHGNYRRG